MVILQECKNVLLIFSVRESGRFQGIGYGLPGMKYGIRAPWYEVWDMGSLVRGMGYGFPGTRYGIWVPWYEVWDMGSLVRGMGYGLPGTRYGIWAPWYEVWDMGSLVRGMRYGLPGARYGIWVPWYEVWDTGSLVRGMGYGLPGMRYGIWASCTRRIIILHVNIAHIKADLTSPVNHLLRGKERQKLYNTETYSFLPLCSFGHGALRIAQNSIGSMFSDNRILTRKILA